MNEKKSYSGYTVEIESVDMNSPYSTDIDKFWYKSIIIPPKEKVKRCMNIGFHNIEFTVKYITDDGISIDRKVKCVITLSKKEGYIILEIDDKELNKREDILEEVSRKLIYHIESILDLKVGSDNENNSLIERDRIGNLCVCANNNLTPTPEFQKLLLKQIVNSDNPLKEIERISELINTIKNYFE